LTNNISLYNYRESMLATSNLPRTRYVLMLAEEVPGTIKAIQTRIPSCRREYDAQETKRIESLSEDLCREMNLPKEWARLYADSFLRATTAADKNSPEVGFCRSSGGIIEAVTIEWPQYGIIVGPQDFKCGRERSYKRKLADGVWLWHEYK
jgi:hypothetical protein